MCCKAFEVNSKAPPDFSMFLLAFSSASQIIINIYLFQSSIYCRAEKDNDAPSFVIENI